MSSRIVALLCGAAVVFAACGNTWTGRSSVDVQGRPGVTDTEIRVGGIASVNSPVGDAFAGVFDGTRAYFEMVNDSGGVHGRRLVLAAEADDGSQPSRNVTAARSLVEEDGVFAVLPVATPVFTGGRFLGESGVPTFGWPINPEWASGPTMFGVPFGGAGAGGDFCIDCAETGPPTFSYLAYVGRRLGVNRVGIIAYSAAQSAQCAAGQRKAFEHFGFDVVFEDSSLGFGFTDVSADVARIAETGVEFLTTCLDGDGSARFSRALHQGGVRPIQYWPMGYDAALAREHAAEMEGVYLHSQFVPFEMPQSSSGMVRYLEWTERTGGQVSEMSVTGWLAADLFTQGVRAAGPDFTRQSVADAIRTLESVDYGGIVRPLDFTPERRGGLPTEACLSYLRVESGRFLPQWVTPQRPWICLDYSAADPLAAPVNR